MSKLYTSRVTLFIIVTLICGRLFIHFDLIELSKVDQIARSIAIPTVIITICYLLWSRYRFVQECNKIPGMKSTLGIFGILGLILQNRRNKALAISVQELISCLPLANFDSNGNRGIFCVFIGPMPVIVLTKPETARVVLFSEHSQRKGQHYDIVRSAIGDGLVTSWGKKWSNHRKLLTPAFHMKIIESVVSVSVPNAHILTSILEKEANQSHDRTIANISPFLFGCTLDVLCQSSMGIDVKCQQSPGTGLNKFLRRAFSLFAIISVTPWMWIPILLKSSSAGREFFGLMNQVSQFADDVITNRMKRLKRQMSGENILDDNESKSSKVKEPFMDIMIHQHMKDAKAFSRQEILDETKTFLVAGHDTTGWALSYTLLLLGHHPDVQEKVHAEIDQFFNENDESDLTQETVKQFIYLDAVLKEAMRLYPPIPIVARRADGPIQIEEFTIPQGAQIAISISALHRDPTNWPDPHRFKPERFLTELINPFAYLPFSAGPRNCIGQRYAMVQSKLELIVLLRKFSIESFTHEDEIAHYFAPVCQTEAPIRVKLYKREVNNNL